MTQDPPRGGPSQDPPRGGPSSRGDRSRIRVHDKRLSSREQMGADQRDTSQEGVQNEGVEKDLSEARGLADDRLDQLKRLKADFENYRKRVIREQTEIVERASLRIVERLLPVLDDLERALEAARQHKPSDAIARGIELVHRHLHEVLVDEGLERVEAEGAFDPNEHEAVSSVAGGVEEPTILEVVRPGYKLRGKTIRPALVHVSLPGGNADDVKEGGD